MFNYFVTSYTFSIGATQVLNYSVTTTTGATSTITPYIFSGVATTYQNTQQLFGVVKCTSATNTITLNMIITTGGGTCKASYYGYKYIKIA